VPGEFPLAAVEHTAVENYKPEIIARREVLALV
jgi:hypothetical protein